jgi:hypothetical protein
VISFDGDCVNLLCGFLFVLFSITASELGRPSVLHRLRLYTQHLANQNFALFVAIRNAAVAQEIPQQFLESTAIAKVFPHVSF